MGEPMNKKNSHLFEMRNTSKIVLLIVSLMSSCLMTSSYAAVIASDYVVIDDFEGTSVPGRSWFYTRIGSDLGAMWGGNGQATLGDGIADLSANDNGWAGVWLHTYHIATPNLMMNTHRVLGPYIESAYQSKIETIKVAIKDGQGDFKIEVIDGDGAIKYSQTFILDGGTNTLELDITNGGIAFDIKQINLISGIANSWAKVDELGVVIQSPALTTEEAVFLYSYAHMSHQYDGDLGLIGERASWEVGALPVGNNGRGTAGVPATALFALATALGKEMGYVNALDADMIVRKIHDKMQYWPTQKGLLPHYLQMNSSGSMVLRPQSEYSSVDTAITLSALILADNIIGINSAPIEAMAENIDWNDLTNNYTEPVSHGYDSQGNLLSYVDQNGSTVYVRWDVFGSESYIIGVLHGAATGKTNLLNPAYQYAPTWDGSGFNDEMAALFFPVNTGTADAWGNNWAQYRSEMRIKQQQHLASHYGDQWLAYDNLGLFGFSAAEVPEKWMVAASDEYKAWGVGGHGGFHDGVNWPGVSYPVVAPHYAAMISAEDPQTFNAVFNYLIQTQKSFTPLNNIESFGLGTSGTEFHWNSLKGSWNLGLQVLGVARALQQTKNQDITYDALRNNAYLKQGFDHMMFSHRGVARALQ